MSGKIAAVARPDGFARTKTLHVRTGYVCQNDCLFCCDGGGGVHGTAQESPFVRQMLEKNVGLGCVEFTAHEPTLNPNLPQWATWARELGYPIVSVVTNGRLLRRGDLLQRLLDAGINRIQISLHGHYAALHDQMTQRLGSFDDTVAGIRAVVAARLDRPGLTLHVHTTVTQHNVHELSNIIPYVLASKPDTYGLNCVFLTASAEHNIGETAVSYVEIVAELLRCLPSTRRDPIFVSEIPICQVVGKLAPDYFGLREGFHLSQDADATAQAVGRGFDFGPRCGECALRNACDGVPPAYVARFGWDAFQPVTQESLARATDDTRRDLRHLLAAPAGEWTIVGLEPRDGYTTVRLQSAKLIRDLSVQVRPRDDAFPAFARTETLNITLAGPYQSKDEILLARKLLDVVRSRE